MISETGERHWVTVEADEAVAARLAGELGIPGQIARILVSRGMADTDQAKAYLHPRLSHLSDPFLFPDMRKAAERIWRAINGQEHIVVFGDYDADGVTSTALLVTVLNELGADTRAFLPSRHTDGYGLTPAALERCLAGRPVGLIVTVDCGTGSCEAVEQAAARGIDVIVTDHHEAARHVAPALAVINPKLAPRESVGLLAGVGVVYKLCQGLLAYGSEQGFETVEDCELRRHLDLVALGTVADVVPLVNENRILVHHGLSLLNSGPRPGIVALNRVAGVRTAIDCYHLGFLIGPRLNAAGRLGDAAPALDLLLSKDHASARRLAGKLDSFNRERKRIEEQIIQVAVETLATDYDPETELGIVVGGDGWHIGAIGIVAARLCGRYHRPSIVVSFDEHGIGKASCRSVEPVDIVTALADCEDLLDSYGGHRMAAGLTVRKEHFAAFRERFNTACRAQTNMEALKPMIQVDDWITLGEADQTLLESIEQLRPMGLGNPTPVWGVRGVTVVGNPRIVGKNHLKLTLAGGASQCDAIAFGMAGRDVPSGLLDVLFHLQENNYLGRRSIQLNIKDFRAATAEA